MTDVLNATGRLVLPSDPLDTPLIPSQSEELFMGRLFASGIPAGIGEEP